MKTPTRSRRCACCCRAAAHERSTRETVCCKDVTGGASLEAVRLPAGSMARNGARDAVACFTRRQAPAKPWPLRSAPGRHSPMTPKHRRVFAFSGLRRCAHSRRIPLRRSATRSTALLAHGPRWTVGVRSGDTPSAERARQARRPPSVLITTPESLSLMLSRADAREYLGAIRCVVVDEWHELIGNKRGVQTQLALARLKRWRPDLLIWGMSATLGNLEEAKRVLLGPTDAPHGVVVAGGLRKDIVIDTLLPEDSARFPWAGHLGIKMAPQVVAEIDQSPTSLVFTNTRSQAEIWYHNLLRARPTGLGSSRFIMGRSRGTRAIGLRTDLRPASLKRSSALRASISAWISFRSNASCRSVRPRALRVFCNAPVAAAIRRDRHHASRSCQVIRWSLSSSLGSTAGGAGRPHRKPPWSKRAARRAGAASRHHWTGWRLQA